MSKIYSFVVARQTFKASWGTRHNIFVDKCSLKQLQEIYINKNVNVLTE
jgi:hypothetical protein